MHCSVDVGKGVKMVVYQNRLPYQFLKTGYHYHCDVIVRDHPTDLGLCYSDVTFQLSQNASFKVSLPGGPKKLVPRF